MQPDSKRFVVADSEPAYLQAGRAAKLCDRARQAVAALRCCRACPRNCGVDRQADEIGFCRIGRHARVNSAFPHFGEEDCLRGSRGSGTIFFSGCNLRCVFCQNFDISQAVAGREYPAEAIADMLLALQQQGCHNVNLVTPEHVVPQVLEALATAVRRGLRLPIVYNTSAYDSVESLRLLDGIVDIYMPDFKFWSVAAAERYLGAGDYGERARAAIMEMHRQVGELSFGSDQVACRGVLVRHLVMPGLLGESAAILRWLAGELSRHTYVNIMGQYHPANRVCGTEFPEINRGLARGELDEACRLARAAGLWRLD